MSTRFFENQEAARRQTSRLVFLFACAVVGIVALLYALAVVLTGLPETDAYGRSVPVPLDLWQPELLVQVGLATLAVVSAGSLYKIAQLRGGGAVVAEALGGQLIPSDSDDPEARKVLNVVEEMAIASGTPAPPVYLMPGEEGINAFAAGFTPGDAVVGVTRGSIQRLSRDELQGVIAHEFSHILSGDMRLNIRLMGAIHGILLIGIIGYFLLRSTMFAGGRRDRDNSAAWMMAAGVGLMVVGFMGTFFGNLIKASVSRQREFLADASAVQFTRNPDGIAGALKKIGGLDAGSLVNSPSAPEASHLFFSNGLRGGLQSLFATHPPLVERIQRLDPSFSGELAAAASEAAATMQPAAAAGFAGQLSAAPTGAAIDQVGEPTAAHLAYATSLLASLPEPVVAACHEPHGARAIVYGMLLSHDLEIRQRQLDRIDAFGESGIVEETLRLAGQGDPLDARARLPLIDLALPSLQRLSADQYKAFEANVRALVEADGRIDLFEWTLQRILFAHLRPHFERAPSRPRHNVRLSRLEDACSVLLSVLARVGSPSDAAAQKAFGDGVAQLQGIEPQLLSVERANLNELDHALDTLTRANPRAVEQLLHACAACVASDGSVTQAEGELIRGIADALEAPMPPLLPGQALI